MKWLAALGGSSLTFAVADILCDVCISEDAPERSEDTSHTGVSSDDSEHSLKSPGSKKLKKIERSGAKYQHLANVDLDEKADDAEESQKEEDHEDSDCHMTGEQDAAVAGMVTILGLVVSVAVVPGATSLTLNSASTDSPMSLTWGLSDYQFWLSVTGGLMAFLHYLLLLKAFEGAPSTVLLPLVQMASVWVLLASSFTAWFTNRVWITPIHLLAYCFMFVGGLLPACHGNVSQLLQKRFWQQKYVWYAVCSELSLGVHDLLLSACSYEEGEDGQGKEGGESTQFFLLSRCSFCVIFLLLFACVPYLRRQLYNLLTGQVRTRYIALSVLSEGLTIVGFYLASIAYGLFYQPSVVHAAEAAMSQVFNLLLAFLLVRVFGIGRSSAAEHFKLKFISFLLVSIGLVMCTY